MRIQVILLLIVVCVAIVDCKHRTLADALEPAMTKNCQSAITSNRLKGATIYEYPRYQVFLDHPCRSFSNKGLEKEELALIHAYTNFEFSSNVFITLNCYLRYQSEVEVPGWVFDFSERLSNVIDKLGVYQEAVWRGSSLHTRPKVGQVIENTSFLSTTADIATAKSFSNNQYLLQFTNHGGASVALYSCMRNEKEVIVKPNQCWKVESVTEESPTVVALTGVPCKGHREAILQDRFFQHRR
jgi:hypothetical protein